jgi:hypothetical protein
MVTLTTGIMLLLFTCMPFCVWGILQRWSTCAPTAYKVVDDCRKSEKHCPILQSLNHSVMLCSSEIVIYFSKIMSLLKLARRKQEMGRTIK